MRLQPLNRFGRWGVFQQPASACPSSASSYQKVSNDTLVARQHGPNEPALARNATRHHAD